MECLLCCLARYDRARPSYPSAAVDKAIELCNIKPNDTIVLDVGAGTGKFTKLLGLFPFS